MAKSIFVITLILNINYSISQDLLLVIDEQFANKTFMGFDDLQGQILGDLYWQTAIGGNPYMNVDIGDGLGTRNLHYYIEPQDCVWTFTRPENAYTNSSSLILEAKPYPDINNLSPTANNQIGTGISLFYPWSFRRGYFEIKAKLPSGDGIQSAFHLFGDLAQIPGFDCDNGEENDKNWQEIDIWETGGSGPNTLRNNIHWSAALITPPPFENFHSCNDFCDHCQYGYRGVDCVTEHNFTTEFHTIGLYWDEQYVIFLLDGDIYRYWVKVFDITQGPGNCNDHPDPVQTGDPRKILFTDAMVLNLGIGYGVSGPYESGATPGNLNGPNPDATLPASQLEVEYFRYWVFLPCENQPNVTLAAVNSNNPQIDTYNNNKIITNYNEHYYGHYETGKEIACANTFIGPATIDGYEPPYWYSDQFNLIGSKLIKLENGFHAKSAENNLPIPSQFHAKIQTCSTIPDAQPMPLVNNMTENAGFTFLENFMWSIGDMIFESYKSSGPLRSNELNNYETSATNQGILKTIDEDFITFNIFPNPTTDKVELNFEFKNETDNCFFEFYDSFGSIIFSGLIQNENESIDLSQISSGTYFLRIYNDFDVAIHKIVKL